MAEADTIDPGRPSPNTVSSLAAGLAALGVRPGMDLLVHSSLKSLGWVCGGAPAVIQALERVLGPEGTLVMPAHSGDLSDPARWRHPPVPEAWWETIRAEMPPYDPQRTLTRGMGAIAEAFRSQPGVLRSAHPQGSICARGPAARTLTEGHALDWMAGPGSPVGRLYELDGSILLLGVGHDRNTSLHLAEYRARWKGKRVIVDRAPVARDAVTVWREFKDIAFQGDDFPRIGEEFEATGRCTTGRVGAAEARLMRQRDLVDFASAWIEAHR